jgi:hypothetical protein
MSFLQRLFQRDPGPPTAEQLSEEALGIGPLPRGESHPVHNADARAALSADSAKASEAQLYARIVSARMAGKWTADMEAIWHQLGKPGERSREGLTAGDAERLDELKRLLTESGE